MSQASQGQQPQSDEGNEPEVTWVGQQWRMDGYCGRAPAEAPQPQPATPELRPVAVVRRAKPSQGKVVRIGPPREAATTTPPPRETPAA